MHLDLNNGWQFIDHYDQNFLSSFPSDAELVDIPHTHKLLPINYFSEIDYQFVSMYQKLFDLSEMRNDKRYFIVFEGLMLQADVYLNDHFLGHFISGYLPFEVEVTDFLKKLDNRLVVVCDAREDKKIPPFGGAVDYLCYGGIYREVHLEERENFFFKELLVSAGMDGHIQVKHKVEKSPNLDLKVRYEIYQDEKRLAVFETDKFVIPNPHLWSPEEPYFYKLRAVIQNKEQSTSKEIRFAFRTIKFTHKGFFLNGEYRKLIGLNRHQSFPYIGYAATKSLQEFDADYLKYHLGLNVVRCSHYPPSRHFLNRCDDIGLLVIDEVPGWQFVGNDYDWQGQYLDFLQRMIVFDYNHPSVILHSIRINESSDYHELYLKANRIAHELDASRPTTGVRNFIHSELLEDVYAFNDFSHDGTNKGLLNPKKVLPSFKTKKPYIVTENNGHMFPTKSFDDENHRLEQAKRHLQVLESAYRYQSIAAFLSWCYADYQTHQNFGSGDHICYHGVVDIFRNDKMAADVYRSQLIGEPMLSVLSSMNIGEYPEALLPPAMVLTNVDFIRVYKNDDLIGDFYPSKKKYPHLPHPPIIIKSYISSKLDHDERFSSKDKKRLKKILGYAGIHGSNRLSVLYKLRVAFLMMKYHLSYADLVELWNKYVSNWGSDKVVYRFVGYRDNAPIISKEYGPSLSFHIALTASKTELKADSTYDMVLVSVELLDQFNNRASYAFYPLHIKTSNNIALLSLKSDTLVGGATSIIIRNVNGKKGVGYLQVEIPYYGSQKIEFEIK
ncbi:MAG TPA: glycoside hydrolase family 2 TIM barrel-domain containing protein [Bacilli bacterium]|nr:glycoside hydrolase family 2 TIM barrel-domain containing protein [Bacilli bacterium]